MGAVVARASRICLPCLTHPSRNSQSLLYLVLLPRSQYNKIILILLGAKAPGPHARPIGFGCLLMVIGWGGVVGRRVPESVLFRSIGLDVHAELLAVIAINFVASNFKVHVRDSSTVLTHLGPVTRLIQLLLGGLLRLEVLERYYVISFVCLQSRFRCHLLDPPVPFVRVGCFQAAAIDNLLFILINVIEFLRIPRTIVHGLIITHTAKYHTTWIILQIQGMLVDHTKKPLVAVRWQLWGIPILKFSHDSLLLGSGIPSLWSARFAPFLIFLRGLFVAVEVWDGSRCETHFL